MARASAAAVLVLLVLVAGCTSQADSSTPEDSSGSPNDANISNEPAEQEGTDTEKPLWIDEPFFDVKENTTRTIASLEKPVLVESFAVWCPTCTRQQKEVKRLHDEFDVQHTSLSLNTDTNEGPAKVAKHARHNEFDWTYGVASPGLLKALQDDFGPSIFVAPNVPKILVCSDTSYRRLPDGVRTAETLAKDIKEGC